MSTLEHTMPEYFITSASVSNTFIWLRYTCIIFSYLIYYNKPALCLYSESNGPITIKFNFEFSPISSDSLSVN